ncbi:MAG: HEAT repeat domain-containing protein [Planctomycetes bacterium]|nr:HEAT repeat domain-containing protein [Planctomycetota bacterium]
MKNHPASRVAPWLSLAVLAALSAPPALAVQAPGTPDTPGTPSAQSAQSAQSDRVDRVDPASTQSDSDAREVRRVLSIAGGGFVRAKSRRTGEHGEQWEYLDGAAWKSLPAERVVKIAVERELLAESKRLGAEAGRDDARRAVYADWLCGVGLLDEGVKELDRVLSRDPDSATALAACVKLGDFVRAARNDARNEAELDEWFRVGAGYGPAMREVTVHQLGERADREQLAARLARELAADSPRTRAFAALALRRLQPGAELLGLASRAVLDGSEDVRREAALALKAAAEPAWVAPIVRALGSQHAAVRANAVEALATMGYPSAIEPLISYLSALSSAQGGGWKPPAASIFVGRQTAYVQDYDVEVAQGAAVADPQIGVLTEGAVLDVRIISAYSVPLVAETRRVREALQRLTHADPGDRAADWSAWWQANRARCDAAAPRTNAGS